jgi:hypothetical protein
VTGAACTQFARAGTLSLPHPAFGDISRVGSAERKFCRGGHRPSAGAASADGEAFELASSSEGDLVRELHARTDPAIECRRSRECISLDVNPSGHRAVCEVKRVRAGACQGGANLR